MSKPLDYTTDLTDHFLIAMPSMDDDLFSGYVVYVCEHSKDGALGLIVNKATDISVKGLFDRLALGLQRDEMAQQPVIMGGPLHQDRGFVLHDLQPAICPSRSHASKGMQYTSSLSIVDGLAMTSSRDILEEFAHGAGPKRALVALGCSSWEAGQLESELLANAWLTVKADPDLIFHTPAARRYAKAFELLGVNPHSISPKFGHA